MKNLNCSSEVNDPYIKAEFIRAIGEDINSYATLYELGFKSENLTPELLHWNLYEE
ncbi:MAG: hypothetical protein IPH57_12870 [Saprospiraceae bacterium]|nr:hypothetical protein [Saprospiraceae bacterium]